MSVCDNCGTDGCIICGEIATLRTRLAAAEAERDELRRRFAEMTTKADAWSYAARALERADQAEAEMARLRESQMKAALTAGEAVRASLQIRETTLQEAAHLFADDVTYWGETVRDRILALVGSPAGTPNYTLSASGPPGTVATAMNCTAPVEVGEES